MVKVWRFSQKQNLNFVERQAFVSFKHGFFQVWGKYVAITSATGNSISQFTTQGNNISLTNKKNVNNISRGLVQCPLAIAKWCHTHGITICQLTKNVTNVIITSITNNKWQQHQSQYNIKSDNNICHIQYKPITSA